MRLAIDRADLAGIVTWAARALPVKVAAPILAGIRLEAADDGTLTASAFDYDTAASATAGARVDEPGAVLVPGRLLHQIAASLDGKVAELETTGAPEPATAETPGRGAELALRCDGARFTLAGLPLDGYPELPAMPAAAGTCGSAAFARAVSRVVIAASHDVTLPLLTAVSLEASGGALTLAATDRYRLAAAVLPWEPAGADGAETRALVPARVLAALAKDPGDATVTIALGPGTEACEACYGWRTGPGAGDDDGETCSGCGGGGTVPSADSCTAGFSDGARQLVTRCVAGEFMRWRNRIPAESPTIVTADSGRLAAAVRQAALAGDGGEQLRVVTVSVNEDGVLLGASGDGKAADIEVGEAAVDGEPLQIMFKPGMLADGLAAAGGRVRIGLTAPSRPALITPEQEDDDYRYLLMPVRPS